MCGYLNQCLLYNCIYVVPTNVNSSCFLRYISGKILHVYSYVTEEECRFTLTAESGDIFPPDKDGDGLYDNNVECLWTIVATEDKYIDLQIMFTDIQLTDDCHLDVLVVSGIYGYT